MVDRSAPCWPCPLVTALRPGSCSLLQIEPSTVQGRRRVNRSRSQYGILPAELQEAITVALSVLAPVALTALKQLAGACCT